MVSWSRRTTDAPEREIWLKCCWTMPSLGYSSFTDEVLSISNSSGSWLPPCNRPAPACVTLWGKGRLTGDVRLVGNSQGRGRLNTSTAYQIAPRTAPVVMMTGEKAIGFIDSQGLLPPQPVNCRITLQRQLPALPLLYAPETAPPG